MESDGDVDALATRRSDGIKVAIEHTLVEPFIGAKTDFHGPFKHLQAKLLADASLQVAGNSLRIYVTAGDLPPGSRWQSIADEIAIWVKAQYSSFPDQRGALLRCPCPSHPSGELSLWVQGVVVPGSHRPYQLIVGRRYDASSIDDSIRKALDAKLPKLARTGADRRILLLERDQEGPIPEDIRTQVAMRRRDYPALAAVDELWIADTYEPNEWFSFSHHQEGKDWIGFEFLGDEGWRFINGIPLPMTPP
jgi:hypothetical protein